MELLKQENEIIGMEVKKVNMDKQVLIQDVGLIKLEK